MRLARRHGEALRIDEEVLNQRFHFVHAVLRRGRYPRIVDGKRPVGAIRSSACCCRCSRFPHLGDTDLIARIDVAPRLHRHTELVRVVAEVREIPADVIVDAGRAGNGSDQPVRHRIVFRNHANALRALQVNFVLREEVFILIEFRGQAIEERAHGVVKAARQVLPQAADAHVARKHAEAGEHLVDVEQELALAEAVEHDRHGAHFHAVQPSHTG
jgi:hypothetical protein